MGRPSITIIREFIRANWRIKGNISISSKWDDRHIVCVLDSEEDVNEALTCPYRKIQHAYFRLFRWSVGFNPKKESTTITKWIRFPELPMEFFSRSGIKALVSSFAYFLDLDDRTYELNSLSLARACVEIDIAQPIPSQIWIQIGDEGFYQDVIVEGSTAYCSRCKIHGHDLNSCKKAAKALLKKTEKTPEVKEQPVVNQNKSEEWQVVQHKKPRIMPRREGHSKEVTSTQPEPKKNDTELHGKEMIMQTLEEDTAQAHNTLVSPTSAGVSIPGARVTMPRENTPHGDDMSVTDRAILHLKQQSAKNVDLMTASEINNMLFHLKRRLDAMGNKERNAPENTETVREMCPEETNNANMAGVDELQSSHVHV